MPSSPEQLTPGAGPSLVRWNARLHYYLGLYFIFFIWLFALTGLLLNHGMWGMADFQRSRITSKSEHRVRLPNTGSPLNDARDLMQQLQVVGEIQWLGTPSQSNRFDFRVTRPGLQTEVRTDLSAGMVTVERTKTNALAISRLLHVFTGVRVPDPKNHRDWIVTKVWAFSMDAVAAGLLAMVLSGLWIWLQSPGRRTAGVIALAAGVISCAWFVVGVRWFSD
jgi:hypothetical protein